MSFSIWRHLGEARLEKYHDLHEYIVGDERLLASPKDLFLLEKRMKADPDGELAEIMWAFENPQLRRIMFARMWQLTDSQFDHLLNRGQPIYFGAYGPSGMGKSMVVGYLLIHAMKKARRQAGLKMELAMARNPEEGNTMLADATARNIRIALQMDEDEGGVGTGSKTEEDSLIRLMETCRILRHIIGRCTIRRQTMIHFVRQCSLVLKTIFQDRINRLNYCMLYAYDDETDRFEMMGIIDIPLPPRAYIARYERMKLLAQIEFTTNLGRHSPLLRRIMPIVNTTVKYVFDNHLQHEIVSRTQLEPYMIDPETGIRADILISSERKDALSVAFRRIQARAKAEGDGLGAKDAAGGSSAVEKMLREYQWKSDFSWQEEVARLMDEDPRFVKYRPFFYASEILGLHVYSNAAEFERVTGMRKSSNSKYLKDMRNDLVFQGWLKDIRGKMFEHYVAQRLRDAGMTVVEHPSFRHEGLTYTEDLLVQPGDGTEFWLNCKCGSGTRTYFAHTDYKATYLLANVLGKASYVLYLDLDSGQMQLHRPSERLAVGAHTPIAGSTGGPSASTPVPPVQLMRVLAGEGTGERSEAVGTTEVEVLMGATVALARLEGIEEAERTLRASQEWAEERYVWFMGQVRARLGSGDAGEGRARGPRRAGGRSGNRRARATPSRGRRGKRAGRTPGETVKGPSHAPSASASRGRHGPPSETVEGEV